MRFLTMIGALILLAGCAHSHTPGQARPVSVYYVPYSGSMDCNTTRAKIGSCGATMFDQDLRQRDQIRRTNLLK